MRRFDLNHTEQMALRLALLAAQPERNAWEQFARQGDLEELSHNAFELMPSIYHNLANQLPSSAPKGTLKGLSRRTWYKNQGLLHELSGHLAALRGAQVQYMLLGATAIAVSYYPDLTMREIDGYHICVKDSSFTAAQQTLSLRGLTRGQDDRLGNKLFLYGAILSHGAPRDEDVFWVDAPQKQIMNEATPVLSPPDQLIYTLLDKHLFFSSKTLWVSDVIRVCEHVDETKRLLDRIDHFRIAHPVKLAIESLFAAFPPASAWTLLEELRAKVKVSLWESVEERARNMGPVGTLLHRAQRKYYRITGR